MVEKSVVKKFFTSAADGKKYETSFYNLDAIISVGYRVRSHVATRFRIWATQRLREFIINYDIKYRMGKELGSGEEGE